MPYRGRVLQRGFSPNGFLVLANRDAMGKKKIRKPRTAMRRGGPKVGHSPQAFLPQGKSWSIRHSQKKRARIDRNFWVGEGKRRGVMWEVTGVGWGGGEPPHIQPPASTMRIHGGPPV